ncbi:hypothetical protein M5689_006751 [Euphorbia peplus]|nr:hypothetical protein M5689_006751 [Euphorbia peplus]
MEKSRRKITVNKYLDFFRYGKQIDITVDHLNQIISMHGFRKFWSSPKKVIMEAIETVDLVNLSRSTLKDNGVSSSAEMKVEDVIADLNEIDWRDCSISSLQTITLSSDSEADISRGSNVEVDGVENGRSALEDRRKSKKLKLHC